jgi:hypothetical protein
MIKQVVPIILVILILDLLGDIIQMEIILIKVNHLIPMPLISLKMLFLALIHKEGLVDFKTFLEIYLVVVQRDKLKIYLKQ